MRTKIPSEHLTEGELSALMSAAQGPKADPRIYLMLLLMVNHGFRASELCKLTREDFGASGAYVSMYRGKGSASGSHPLTDEERELLEPYMSSPGRLFGIHRQRLYGLVRELAEGIGLPQSKQSPHCLRHTCIKRALKAGASLPAVQRFVGHKSLASTGVYAKVSEAEAVAECMPKKVEPYDDLPSEVEPHPHRMMLPNGQIVCRHKEVWHSMVELSPRNWYCEICNERITI